MRFKDEEEIGEVLRAFEDATISRDEWKHAEHLTVALHYVSSQDIETATENMRSGILKLLAAFGVDLRKEMPYHETMTVFWMRTVAEFNARRNGDSNLAKTNEMIAIYDRDYPLRFYTRELLFSDEARNRFVLGDIVAE